MYGVSKNEMYLYWAVVGLCLDSKNLIGFGEEKKVIAQLAKRVFSKIKLPSVESNLFIEYRNLSINVNLLAGDNVNILKSIYLDTKLSSSDDAHLAILTNIKLKNYDEAMAICLSEMDSCTFIDSTIWTYLLEISKEIPEGISLAKKIIHQYGHIKDIRGIKYASMELKIAHDSAFSETASDMLLDYAHTLSQKPSTFNDIVFFIKKLDNEQIYVFYLKIIEDINSVT